MVKLHVMKQQKKIKDLNQTVRRLRKKLSSFDALFRHLKSNNLITENAHDDILVLRFTDILNTKLDNVINFYCLQSHKIFQSSDSSFHS